MRRGPATTVYLALSGIFVLGAFLQPFTFRPGVLRRVGRLRPTRDPRGESVLSGVSLLALIAALAGPDRRRDAPWALGLIGLVAVQILLPDTQDDAAGLAALHPLLGVIAIGMAGWMHLLARRPSARAEVS